jgi:hypothetical protein
MRRKMESVLLLTMIVGIGGDVVTMAFQNVASSADAAPILYDHADRFDM